MVDLVDIESNFVKIAQIISRTPLRPPRIEKLPLEAYSITLSLTISIIIS